jgi:GH25 family lysozyme M1 (1,4-beta-N-acetylmuramidase)
VKGIDVSSHQGSVDFAKVKQAGHGFAICKASEGQDFRDPSWTAARVTAIRKAGLKVGVYHYLRPRPGRTGAVEARFAVKTARDAGWGRGGDIRLAMDVEETDLGAAATRRYVREFADEYRDLTGHWPVLYTFPHFAQTVGFGDWLADRCPLWIAHFDTGRPTVPKPWGRYAIWQHSSTGRVAGVRGNVDLNRVPDKGKLPLVPAVAKPKAKPSRRERIARRARAARARYLSTHSNRALRIWLISKARLGRWDPRYCLYYGVPTTVNAGARRFITRGFAAGLVPTSTLRAARFPGDRSYHMRGQAADMGARRDISAAQALKRKQRFQAAEYRRRHKTRPIELIGPLNDKCVLAGAPARLAEGTPLEDQHDDHVHAAWA